VSSKGFLREATCIHNEEREKAANSMGVMNDRIKAHQSQDQELSRANFQQTSIVVEISSMSGKLAPRKTRTFVPSGSD